MIDDGFATFSLDLSPDEEARASRLQTESTIVDMIWWGPVTHRSYTTEMDAVLRCGFDAHGDIGQLMDAAMRLPGRMAVAGTLPEYRSNWDQSGITAGHYEVQVGDARALLDGITHVDYLVDHLPWLRKALSVDDIRSAKRDGGHALYVECQPTTSISRDIGLIDAAYDGGLRSLQLTYNVQDVVGCGCTDRTGGGISDFGATLIERLNQLGVIVDAAHCSKQTILDACALSSAPVLMSHTGASALHRHDRTIDDESAEAIAGTGGLVGVVTVPFFLGSGDADLGIMLDHIDHFVRLLGAEHVGIGTDWPMAAPKWVMVEFDRLIRSQGFKPEHGIVTTQNLVGFDDYRDFPNITRGLVARGYTDDQIRGMLGENFIRLFSAVCG